MTRRELFGSLLALCIVPLAPKQKTVTFVFQPALKDMSKALQNAARVMEIKDYEREHTAAIRRLERSFRNVFRDPKNFISDTAGH